MNKQQLFKGMLAVVLSFSCSVFAVTKSNISGQDNSLSAQEKAQGWQLLFNGQDMQHWRNFKQQDLNDKWQVIDGEMRLTAGGGGDILTKQVYENFELMLDWKISLAGNSGIFILADEIGKQIYSHAIEVQILDNERHADNKVASHLSGSIYDMVAAPLKAQLPAEQWNTVHIRLFNKHLSVWQNGVLTTDILIGGEQWHALLAESKFSKWQGFGLNTEGHIGLQDHSDPVAFKNIKIKVL